MSGIIDSLTEMKLNDNFGVIDENLRFVRGWTVLSPKKVAAALAALEQVAATVPDQLKGTFENAKQNLMIVQEYGRRIGGRSGAGKFLGRLIANNPGHFCITKEDHEEVTRINAEIMQDYKDRKALTLTDAIEINRRIRQRLGNRKFEMPADPRIEKERIDAARQKGPLDGYTEYRAQVAARLFPALDALVKEGKIQSGKPLLLVEAGNNDIRNNIQTDLVRVLVQEYLDAHKLDVPVQVHLLSFGGHPTTGTFVAHVEVMTSQERCRLLQKIGENEMVFKAFEEAAAKIPEAQAILHSDRSWSDKLEALLQNDKTRPIFRLVGGRNHTIHHPDFQPGQRKGLEKSIYMFNGVGESTTHRNLSILLGHQKEGELHMDELSRDTGENIAFLAEQMPKGEEPVILFFDAYRTGRQVVSLSKQLKAPWSTIVAPLINIPLEHYTKGLMTEQLYADTASLFAELARNIAYRTTDDFVDPFPIPDGNYRLLARYYAAMKGISEEEAMKTPIAVIFPAVRKEFEQFEITFRPGYTIKKHPKHFARFTERQWLRKMLLWLNERHLTPDQEKALGMISIPRSVLPPRLTNK